MYKKGFSAIAFIGIATVLAIAASGYIYFRTPEQGNDITACLQDAKICPDGSSVGRTGPNCEFAQCLNTGIKNQEVEGMNTNNWKTYRNDEYGFEFRYPANFELREGLPYDGRARIGDLSVKTPAKSVRVGIRTSYDEPEGFNQIRTISIYCPEGLSVDVDIWEVETENPFPDKKIQVGGYSKTLRARPISVYGDISYNNYLCESSGRICFNFVGAAAFSEIDEHIFSSFKLIKPLDSWDPKTCIYDAGDIRDQS